MIQTPEEGERSAPLAGAHRLTATVLTLTALAVFLYFIQRILIPFVLAGALAYILSVAVDFLAGRTKMRRTPAAILVFLAVLGMGAAAGAVVYPSLKSAFSILASDLKGALTETFEGVASGGRVSFLGETYAPEELADRALALLRGCLGDPANAVTVTGYGFASVFGIFLTGVLLFYLLVSGRELVKSLLRLAPPQHRPLIREILARIDPILRRYFVGVLIIAIYAGVAAYIGLGLILGLRHAVLLAISTGILEMIPVAGPFLAALLAGLVALHRATSVGSVLAYVVYATALRLSIDQLFGPIVLGRAASLSPVTIIFCFLAGGRPLRDRGRDPFRAGRAVDPDRFASDLRRFARRLRTPAARVAQKRNQGISRASKNPCSCMSAHETAGGARRAWINGEGRFPSRPKASKPGRRLLLLNESRLHFAN
jgi:predicted PurR-regulated permease PerM